MCQSGSAGGGFRTPRTVPQGPVSPMTSRATALRAHRGRRSRSSVQHANGVLATGLWRRARPSGRQSIWPSARFATTSAFLVDRIRSFLASVAAEWNSLNLRTVAGLRSRAFVQLHGPNLRDPAFPPANCASNHPSLTHRHLRLPGKSRSVNPTGLSQLPYLLPSTSLLGQVRWESFWNELKRQVYRGKKRLIRRPGM